MQDPRPGLCKAYGAKRFVWLTGQCRLAIPGRLPRSHRQPWHRTRPDLPLGKLKAACCAEGEMAAVDSCVHPPEPRASLPPNAPEVQA